MAQFPTREAEIAAAEQATTTKDEALEGLTDAMRADLRYAENTVDFDDDKLKLLGWGGRKAGTSLEPCARAKAENGDWDCLENRTLSGVISMSCRLRNFHRLRVRRSLMNSCPCFLPTEVASYKIERRERPEGRWSIPGVAVETESTLTSQERGKEWEYRLIAVNKAGEGTPSNTVMAVL